MSEEAEDVGDDDDVADGEEGGGKSGFGGKKLVLFIVLPLLLLGLGGAGLFFSGLLDSILGVEQVEEVEEEPKEAEAELPGHYIDLDEMLVTLAAQGRKQSFLKMRISLEISAPEDEARVVAVMPRIIDNFQVFLRELRVEELQGSRGIYRVKEELLSRVNAAAHPAKVKDVLFREILVQ